jgi:hypothetical protein
MAISVRTPDGNRHHSPRFHMSSAIGQDRVTAVLYCPNLACGHRGGLPHQRGCVRMDPSSPPPPPGPREPPRTARHPPRTRTCRAHDRRAKRAGLEPRRERDDEKKPSRLDNTRSGSAATPRHGATQRRDRVPSGRRPQDRRASCLVDSRQAPRSQLLRGHRHRTPPRTRWATRCHDPRDRPADRLRIAVRLSTAAGRPTTGRARGTPTRSRAWRSPRRAIRRCWARRARRSRA